MFIYKYLEMNDTKINFSILLTSNVPVQIIKYTSTGTCTQIGNPFTIEACMAVT